MCINCQLIAVFDGNDKLCIFSPRRRRRAVIPSVPERQAVVFNHSGVEGAGRWPLEMVYFPSLLHSSVDIKKY